MPRYIDADAMKYRLASWCADLALTYGENDEYVLCLEEVLKKLDDATTVYPVDVVMKMKQADRVLLSSAILESVYEEMIAGSCDDSMLQDAVICQIFINRIVYRLNERRH